jgi:hypothetical protein
VGSSSFKMPSPLFALSEVCMILKKLNAGQKLYFTACYSLSVIFFMLFVATLPDA